MTKSWDGTADYLTKFRTEVCKTSSPGSQDKKKKKRKKIIFYFYEKKMILFFNENKVTFF